MSLLPNISYANTNTPLFLLANISSLNVNTVSTNSIQTNTLNANFISTADCELSSIFATVLDLDGQVLTANPTELLLNGIPLATTANLSSLTEWAFDPAISSINANNNDLLSTNIGYFQTISTTNVLATNIIADNILAKNIFALSTYTSTISSLIEVAEVGIFSTLSAGTANFSTLSSISIDTQNITASTITALTSYISTIISDSASFSSVQVSSINGNEFTQSTITTSSISVNVLGVSSLVATSISSIGAEIRQAFMSSIVFSPSLNPSLGGVDVNLGLGGLLGNVVGWGAGVFGAAAGTVGLVTGATALYQGRQSQNITTNSYELVNGTTQLQISTLGTSFSTIYRFNNSTDPTTVPGEEIFISTIYPPGLAIRSLSDPLYTLSTPQSTIQAQGQWVSLGDTLDVADWSLYPAISTIQGANNDLVAVRNADISTISTAIIYGANPDVFGVFGVSGLKIDAPNLFLSTPQVVHPGFFNGSTIGANLIQAPTLSTNSILCSTGTILVSTISAQQVTTQSLTINSSIFSTSTTAGTQSQPAGRLILGGTDFDLGQNDLWVQQVRVGAANPGGSGQTEVILYAPDNTQRGLGIGSQDRTLRVVSTINATGGGYLLDTTINPPTFSTISTTTNLGSFFPSTALSTIGWSTITAVPQYYCSAFSSTSQTVVGANTITPLTHDYTGINIGGFTVLGSTITVPVAGVYEIQTSIQFDTSSGGTNIAEFWFKKNGTDLVDSASGVSVTGQGETLGTVALLDVAQAGDKYAIIIASSDANMTATNYPPTVSPYTRPRIPSVITSLKRLQ